MNFQLLAIRLLIIAAIAGGSYFGGLKIGETVGAKHQQDADAPVIKDLRDAVAARDTAITNQKLEAARVLEERDAALLAQKDAEARLHHEQEAAREADRRRTDDARRVLADQQLRIDVPLSSIAGCRSGGPGAVPDAADAAGAAGTASVQLPEPAGRDLRQLVLEADQLADAYRACYRFVFPNGDNPVSPTPAQEPQPAAPAEHGDSGGGGPTIPADTIHP